LEENLSAWKNLKTLVKIEATREIRGKTTQEVRYYINETSASGYGISLPGFSGSYKAFCA
jgi:hypothetical protein